MSTALECFLEDFRKYNRINTKNKTCNLFKAISVLTSAFGLQCVAVYRLGQFARELRSKSFLLAFPFSAIYRVLNFYVQAVYHVSINGSIGPGFYIGHIGTIYISAEAIGANVSVTHNVTIGKGHSAGKNGYPTIGNNVWMGSGSVISGAIRIGDDATICCGSILSVDVPPGCFVCGNPARPLMRNMTNSHLFGLSTWDKKGSKDQNESMPE